MAGLHLLAGEQAPRGALAAGQEKKGELATTSLEFEHLHRKSRCERLLEMLICGDNICSSPWRSNLKVFPCENRARNGARSIFCGTKTEKPVPRSFLVCVLACSRLSDSGEDAKVKGTRKVVRAFSIQRAQLSRSLEQAICVQTPPALF